MKLFFKIIIVVFILLVPHGLKAQDVVNSAEQIIADIY